MHVTETLRHEHRWIRRLLDCLEELAHRAESRAELDAIASSDLLSLLEGFVDRGHQEKEERFLFRALLVRTNAAQSAYVRRLFKDHKEERHDLESLRAHMLGAARADPSSVRQFVHQARAYAVAQRRHLAHEEIVLLPMAERLLGVLDDRRIHADFELVPGASAEIAERIEALCRRLGLAAAASTT